jgi:putative membrane protein
MGWKRTLTFLVTTYVITFLCEFSSTRNGFPFGPYTYFDETRTRELWISNVPFWDSLSFVFLSYFSFVIAAEMTDVQSRFAPWIGGLIMMLLDVVIDPLTLQGDKWFLGRIYNYPYRGFYFGVTAENFAGWFFVGFATQWFFQRCLRVLPWCRGEWKKPHPLFIWAVFAVYAGVFGFNLAITLWIKDYELASASGAISAVTLAALGFFLKRKRATECVS